MNLVDSFGLARQALKRNRTRAILTMLGVVIGVASVIAMASVATGARERITSQLEEMGTNNLIVRAGSAWRSGIRSWSAATRLKNEDAAAISKLPEINAVAPLARVDVQSRFRGRNWATRVEGVTPEFLQVTSWKMAMGEFINHRHVSGAANVCVLGQTVVQELFGLANPIGENIIIRRVPCKVIGVLSVKGPSSWGRDQDDIVLAPLSTIQRRITGKYHLHRIVVQTESREQAQSVAMSIRRLMRKRHRLMANQDDDFRINIVAELAEVTEESANVFTWLLGSIASVSLLVGGVGIMNVMLVSVTERTREIGIRMAIGAQPKDILQQFLLEASLLSGVGGVVGVVVGVVSSILLAQLSGLAVSITLWSILTAFLFSILVGVFFGLHPARRAALFKPVEALRYE